MRNPGRTFVIRAAALGVSLGLLGFGLGIIEVWLRHEGTFATYFEQNGLADPGHRTEHLAEPYLHIYKPRQDVVIARTEFTIRLRANGEGLLGPDMPLLKAPGEYRIITIGDSFTEGVGADAAHSYPAVLARLLAARPRSTGTYTVMNAGISASDPVYEIELLRRKLIKYEPDLVILALNNSDLNDLERRGGVERYRADGQLQDASLPWWTWFFDHSHLVRALILRGLGYDWNLRPPVEAAASARRAVSDIVQSGVTGARLAAEHGFRLLVVVHPMWQEVQSRTLDPGLVEVEAGLKAAGVDYADLLPHFVAAIPNPIPPDYYWPKDRHYTAKGYEVFARAVDAAIERRVGTRP